MSYRIINGDVEQSLAGLEEGSIQCCVTSPPYWGLRDYGVEGQIGLEATPDEFVEKLVEVFRGVRRVLRDDGTLWLNIGDSYAGQGAVSQKQTDADIRTASVGNAQNKVQRRIGTVPGLKPKDLCLIPYRLVLALQADGWWVRSQIVWAKKSSMPESVRDRPTSAWEPIFLLTKQAKYYYDAEAVRQEAKYGRREWSSVEGNMASVGGGRGKATVSGGDPSTGANLRNVWHLGPEPFPDAHFATYPTEIPRRAILAGTSAKGCCPECGAPWERVVEREAQGDNSGKRDDNPRAGIRGSGISRLPADAGQVAPKTIGWAPTCDHGLDPVPCRVLDPFLGSGTTCMVAEQLGRDSIGIELSEEYAAMAEKRIQKGLPLTRRKSAPIDDFRLDFTEAA